MQDIINGVGEQNIYIIIAIIFVIIIALIVIIIIEKRHDKLENFNEFEPQKEKKFKRKKKEEEGFFLEEEQIELPFEKEEIEEEPVVVAAEIKEKEEYPIKKTDDNLVYVSNVKTKEEAKKAIEEAAKKLVYEEPSDIISQTFFEKIQEEQSIISYDELMNTNVDLVLEDRKEIMDEGNEPITLDEIYVKEEKEIKQEEPKKEDLIELPLISEESKVEQKNDNKEVKKEVYAKQEEKFKPSDVISPVFGVKREVVYQKEYNEFGETIDVKELEVEIKKTEEFLKELKKLKNKLD